MKAASMHCERLPTRLQRWLAAGGVALILAVGVLAASPQLHQWLHPDAAQADHECAVTLFHHGLAKVVTAVALPPVPMQWVARQDVPPTALDLVAPHFRLIPGRAPPGR